MIFYWNFTSLNNKWPVNPILNLVPIWIKELNLVLRVSDYDSKEKYLRKGNINKDAVKTFAKNGLKICFFAKTHQTIENSGIK